MKKKGKTVAIERNERDEKEPFKGMERERAKEEIKERKGEDGEIIVFPRLN